MTGVHPDRPARDAKPTENEMIRGVIVVTIVTVLFVAALLWVLGTFVFGSCGTRVPCG